MTADTCSSLSEAADAPIQQEPEFILSSVEDYS